MKHEFVKAITHGELVCHQTFETEKGEYILAHIRYNDEIILVKYLNKKLVECRNLSKMKAVKK